jgi:hypothetical protein
MKTKFFLWCALSFAAHATFSQNVYLIRYSGAVLVNGLELQSNYKFLLDANDKVVFEKGAKALAVNKSKQYEITAARREQTNRANLLAKLNRQPQTVSFWKYIENLYGTISMGEQTKGSIKAGVKGLNDGKFGPAAQQDFDEFSPVDSALVFADEPKLEWRTDKKILYPHLMIIHADTNDTIYNQPEKLHGSVRPLLQKEGNYKWILYSKADKKNKIVRHFKKISEAEAIAAEAEFARFEKQISGMSEQTRQQLLKDYAVRYKIIRE